MQLSQPTLEPHSLCYTCWVQVVYSLLPTLLFFLLGILYCCSVPADAREYTRSYQEYEDFLAVVSQSTSLWRPAFESSVLVLRFCILCIRHFVINVINNIRIRFIISFTLYVLWYTVHSVVYTCDLILARIWLLGLCPFVNRVLHLSPRIYIRAGRDPLKKYQHLRQYKQPHMT